MTLFSPKTELYIDGAWVDISAYVRYASGVEIGRGRADEQGELTPSRLALTLANLDGRFSNRNPGSPYFGLLGRNTPIRQSVTGFPVHLRVDGGGYATTPDAAALDIVGDIDVRADIEPESWRPATRLNIASKTLLTGDQRSWYLSLTTTGTLEFGWSSAGTFPYEAVASTAAVPSTSRRLAVRAVLDVSNAGNHTVTFYTGTSVATATTQLGAVVTTAGVTSIFSGTAALEVGSGNAGTTVYSDDERFIGRIYRVQVRNSAGTLVADPDFTAQAAETTSFSDTFRTWTVVSPGYVTHDGIRFRGEVPTWPTRWDLSGRDVFTPIEAAGITRRLTQGAVPLRSTIYRNLAQYDSSITLGWWTFEDESGSTTAASAVSGGQPATVTAITFAADDTLPGAAPVATIDDATTSRIFGSVKRVLPSSSTGWSVLLYFRLPAVPAGDNTLIRWTSSGTIATWQLIVGVATYNLYGFDATGTQVLNLTTLFGSGASPNQWIAMRAKTTVSAGTVTYELAWHAIGSTTFYSNSSTYSGSPGSPRGWSLSGQTALVDAAIGHVWIGDNSLPFDFGPFANSSNGYLGERAAARMQRLCDEEGVDLRVHYVPTDRSAEMGRQGIGTFVELITACADADLGILYEPRDMLGYGYWPQDALYNALGPTFDYGEHIAEPFEPTDDDQQIRNAVTATRPGSTVGAVAEQEDGPLSILPPPTGVGRYEASYDVNVSTDAALTAAAEWLRHLGTYDELRYPAVSFLLGNSAFTGDTAATSDAVRIDIGRRFTVDELPAWLPPDPVPVLPQGTSERLTTDEWGITATTVPAGTYDVGVYDATDSRWDSRTTTLGSAPDDNDTSWTLSTTDPDDVWSTTETPYDLVVCRGGVRGEVVTCTAMGAPSGSGPYTQTATVTRSVNGVVSAWDIGDEIHAADAGRWAR